MLQLSVFGSFQFCTKAENTVTPGDEDTYIVRYSKVLPVNRMVGILPT